MQQHYSQSIEAATLTMRLLPTITHLAVVLLPACSASSEYACAHLYSSPTTRPTTLFGAL